MGVHRRSRKQRERGAAAVEFALVVPILLVLFFGIVQFSIYFWSAQTGTYAATAAVRRLAVGDCQTSSELKAYVSSRLGSANQGSLIVTPTYTDFRTTPPSPVSPPLPATAVGDTVSLTVSFQSLNMHFPIPFLPDTTITKTVDARVEDNNQDSPCS